MHYEICSIGVEQMNFVGKLKGFLLAPSKTFDACKEETLDEAMIYYLRFTAVISAVVALFFIIYYYKFGSFLGFTNLKITERLILGGGLGIAAFFFSIVVIWMEGAIIHIGVYFWGGRKGVNQTIKAFIYSLYVLGLLVLVLEFLLQVPYVSETPHVGDSLEIIVSAWFLILIILGVRQLQEITTFRAVAGVLFVPLVAALVSVIYAFIFGAFP